MQNYLSIHYKFTGAAPLDSKNYRLIFLLGLSLHKFDVLQVSLNLLFVLNDDSLCCLAVSLLFDWHVDGLGPSTLRASAAGLETVGTLRLLLLDIKRHLFVILRGH